MGTVLLREAVVGKKTVQYNKKDALRATKCDACGKLYQMSSWCNDDFVGLLRGTFDKMPGTHGNMFDALVCSFACAEQIMQGGWKKLEEYKDFVAVGATLVRAEVKITTAFKTEQELIDDWESKPERS